MRVCDCCLQEKQDEAFATTGQTFGDRPPRRRKICRDCVNASRRGRICTKCGKYKAKDQFYKDKRHRKNKLRTQCKTCMHDQRLKWRRKHITAYRAYQALWYKLKRRKINLSGVNRAA